MLLVAQASIHVCVICVQYKKYFRLWPIELLLSESRVILSHIPANILCFTQ